jgi:hypothetical protein
MPIKSFICRDCDFEFDAIVSHDAPDTRKCDRCDDGTAYKMPSIPAPARGSFGTVRRDTSKQAVQPMKFAQREEQLELPLDGGKDE